MIKANLWRTESDATVYYCLVVKGHADSKVCAAVSILTWTYAAMLQQVYFPINIDTINLTEGDSLLEFSINSHTLDVGIMDSIYNFVGVALAQLEDAYPIEIKFFVANGDTDE